MKNLVRLLFAAVMMIGSTHAQLQRQTNLGDIIIKFCDDTIPGGAKTAVLEAEPQKPLDICMLIQNDGPSDATISINFVDGTITQDSDQKKACEPETTKSNFGQYVSGYNTTIKIPSGTTIQTGAIALFPAGYAGISYGCVTFQVVNDAPENTNEAQMFTIVSRRASFVDVNVKGDYIIDLQAQDAATQGSLSTMSSDKISVVDSLLIPWNNVAQTFSQSNILNLRIGKPLITRSVLYNSGNIGLDVSISSTYRAWFGLINIDLGSQQQQFVPKQSKAIEFITSNAAWWLGGPSTITQTITYKPIIIGNGGIDPALLAPQTMILVSSGFVTAWIGWGIMLIVIILITTRVVVNIRSYKKHKNHKKHKKHHDK